MEKAREIVRLWMNGGTHREIAEKAGTTKGYVDNVVSVAHALGFKGTGAPGRTIPIMSPEQDQEAVRLRSEGATYRQLAERYGVSIATVLRAFRRAGRANDGVPGRGE